MKGDRGVPATCPVCGAAIHPRAPLQTRQHHQTTRTITRHATREHIVAHHPDLSPRAISLLLDQVCDALEKPAVLPLETHPFFAVRERISLTIQNSATVREDDCGRPTKRRGGSSR